MARYDRVVFDHYQAGALSEKPEAMIMFKFKETDEDDGNIYSIRVLWDDTHSKYMEWTKESDIDAAINEKVLRKNTDGLYTMTDEELNKGV